MDEVSQRHSEERDRFARVGVSVSTWSRTEQMDVRTQVRLYRDSIPRAGSLQQACLTGKSVLRTPALYEQEASQSLLSPRRATITKLPAYLSRVKEEGGRAVAVSLEEVLGEADSRLQVSGKRLLVKWLPTPVPSCFPVGPLRAPRMLSHDYLCPGRKHVAAPCACPRPPECLV